ncbi:hypothetical protein Daqu01_03305 [Deinococcus aquaticus]
MRGAGFPVFSRSHPGPHLSRARGQGRALPVRVPAPLEGQGRASQVFSGRQTPTPRPECRPRGRRCVPVRAVFTLAIPDRWAARRRGPGGSSSRGAVDRETLKNVNNSQHEQTPTTCPECRPRGRFPVSSSPSLCACILARFNHLSPGRDWPTQGTSRGAGRAAQVLGSVRFRQEALAPTMRPECRPRGRFPGSLFAARWREPWARPADFHPARAYHLGTSGAGVSPVPNRESLPGGAGGPWPLELRGGCCRFLTSRPAGLRPVLSRRAVIGEGEDLEDPALTPWPLHRGAWVEARAAPLELGGPGGRATVTMMVIVARNLGRFSHFGAGRCALEAARWAGRGNRHDMGEGCPVALPA